MSDSLSAFLVTAEGLPTRPHATEAVRHRSCVRSRRAWRVRREAMVLGGPRAARARRAPDGRRLNVREIADTEAKAPGIDLLATMAGRWLAIEVKGYPNTTYDHGPKRGMPKPTQPTNQAKAVVLTRAARHDAASSQATGRGDRDLLPRFKTYESLLERTRLSFELLGFGVYLVADDGSVHEWLRARPVLDGAGAEG